MKRIKFHLTMFLVFASAAAFSQSNLQTSKADSTGFPGDNFSLEGALALFKKASTVEEFEKQLNSENNYVNNIDLDGNGETDYIQVKDNYKNSLHAIVLQVAVSEKETQDIAVIEIEKTGEKTAQLQIIGDEDIYGSKKIIEPFDESETKEKSGPAAPTIHLVIVNVWFWPCVTYIYTPGYVAWQSSWYWHHYPHWWRPWKPYPWYHHHSHCKPYHNHFRPAPKHRVTAAHQVYVPHRKVATSIKNPKVIQHRSSIKPKTITPKRITPKSNITHQKATYSPRSNGGQKSTRGKPGGGSGKRK